MRKLYLIISFLLFGTISQAQTYISFPQDSAQWHVGVVYDASYGNLEYYNYHFYLDGDTILNNRLYSKLYNSMLGYIGGIREENKNIYISPRSTQFGWDYYFPTTSDNLLYTFDSLYVGKTFAINSHILTVNNIDSVEFDGVFHKRYDILGSPVFQERWIEGIGSDHELLANYFPMPVFECDYSTFCYEPNPYTTYYLDPNFNFCSYTVGIDDYNPQHIRINPNPVIDVVKLSTDALQNNVIVTNTLGHVMVNSTFPKDIIIEVSSFATGLYYITIINDKGITTGKFVHKRP